MVPVPTMVFAFSCLIFCLLAVLVADVLGSLGGIDTDLNAIVGAAMFVLAGLALGVGALLFGGDVPETDGPGPDR